MATNLAKEIADKAAILPIERQREVLALLEAMNANTQPETKENRSRAYAASSSGI
ncbi:MAG: hypothetical protein WKF84_04475 [Pyrinomonadaceae bacterium]